MEPFIVKLRVRHYEMDALGHVNNAVYLHYLEQAAIEHSEHLGFTLKRYQELQGAFVLRRMEIEYQRPAIAGDYLEIATWLRDMKGTRATRCYELRRAGESEILVAATALWVWVETATMRPKAIPAVLLAGFLRSQQDPAIKETW